MRLVVTGVLRILLRTLAVLVGAGGATVSALVFYIGAPVVAGAEFKEPVGVVCVDPWVEAHPGDFEPEVHGWWSWWPPGITCVHASGEVFIEPSASDAVGVIIFGLLVLSCGIGSTLVVAVLLWRGPRPAEAGPVSGM